MGRGGTMIYTRVSESVAELGIRAIRAMKSTRFMALAMVAIFTSVAMQPAQAQTSDRWKSLAIIGGSTAVGAYVGHKVAGRTGALVGAGVGASAGYAIDQRRRNGAYYNQDAYNGYGDNGYYGNNSGYNGNNGGYYGNDGYYGGSADAGAYGYPYPAGYQSSSSYQNNRSTYQNHNSRSGNRCSSRR